MKKAIRTLNGAKTAHVLASRLGLGRNWATTLTDFRRGRVMFGPILLPIGVCRDSRMKRPLYALTDIAAFIAEYLTFDLNARPFKLEAELHAVDTADLARPWKYRPLVCIVALPSTTAPACATTPAAARPAAPAPSTKPTRSPATRSLPPRSTKDFDDFVVDDEPRPAAPAPCPAGTYAH